MRDNTAMKRLPLNWGFLALTVLITTALFAVGLQRLEIDTDILSSLPQKDPVIADAAYVLTHHPMQSQVAVDIGIEKPDPDLLIACGRMVEKRLKASGLFKSVGMEDFQGLMPDLLDHAVADLPVLFSAAELEARVRPLLKPEEIKTRLDQVHTGLLGLEGIGQEALIAKDPLNLRALILERLAHLVPAGGARILRGSLVSADGRHLLLTASPAGSGTDTESAAAIAAFMDRLAEELGRDFGRGVTLSPVGAYRAALDNQRIIKRDITLAVALSTLGIGVLLLFSFYRPLVGLFALLPALAGTMLAYFIFSLFHDSISILVLGFGGAIISLSVDQGIAYLLFLDRPEATTGRAASEEVRGMGLLAVLTTVAAFGTLCLSGFPVFVQLGQFTMLGLGLCYFIVHVVFPRIFPELPPGGSRSFRLQKAVDALGAAGWQGAFAAALFTAVMLLFAKPVFNVSLQAMNTVGADTLAAEKRLTEVWGGFLSKVHLLTEGRTIAELQARGDALVEKIESDLRSGVLSSGFVSSMLFPGEALRRRNFAAWKGFWSAETVTALKHDIERLSAPLGFAEKAFAPFFVVLSADAPPAGDTRVLAQYPGILGISRNADGSQWIQVSTLATGPAYDAEGFHAAYKPSARIFDPLHFSESLGKLLRDTGIFFFLVNVVCSAALVALFTADLRLTLACMAPLAFAFIATLGTLKILGRPLDIPGLMLSIIVFGLGIDYAVFFVRSFQRYGTLSHPAFGRIRMTVFLSAATTLFGFGAMWAADHSVLKSTGATAFLGIGYSMLGAFLILPPALGRIERRRQAQAAPAGGPLTGRAAARFRHMEAYPRFFSRCKLRWDPMFAEMEKIFQSSDGVKTILDIGSGFGVPAGWLLERFEGAVLHGIEPAAERVRVASAALGSRGTIRRGRAPELPDAGASADLATMIDMVHFLSDEVLSATLEGLQQRLRPGGRLVLRASVPPTRRFPWAFWYQNAILRLKAVPVFYRPAAALERLAALAGFRVEALLPSGADAELVWLIGVKT